MLIYPEINPVAVSLGPIKIHWYGLMYIIGLLIVWLLANYRARKHHLNWTKEQISEIIFYGAFGVILGGRLGEMLFYEWKTFLADPLSLFRVWQGGMSFHGGLIGVVIAFLLLRKKISKSFFEITDFIIPYVPLALAAGRLGNFINGELWGRVTDVPWGMVFPHVDMQPRHPSQLYEFFLEGILLFLILWFYSAKPRPRMASSGLFLILYGFARVIVEFFREPEVQQGFIFGGWVTMGQLLSLPMILAGILLMYAAYKRKESTHASIS